MSFFKTGRGQMTMRSRMAWGAVLLLTVGVGLLALAWFERIPQAGTRPVWRAPQARTRAAQSITTTWYA